MLCIRVWSPGARVGQAALKRDAMKGTGQGDSSVASGIDMGTFGFAIEDVGSGGRDNISFVNPGTSNATTFCIEFAF